jgi:hypothetical protein
MNKNPLSYMCFENIFSVSGLSFHFLTLSFEEQKLLILMNSTGGKKKSVLLWLYLIQVKN